MSPTQIHQFSFACNTGDGVTNSLFYIRKLLRSLGFISNIYSETIPEDLRDEVLDFSQLPVGDDVLLFSHHCLGYDNWQWLLALPIQKVMVYHNITPTELLPAEGDIRRWADLGREQLCDWAPHFLGAIGVSQFNTLELHANKYSNVATIPMLVDFEKLTQIQPDVEGLADLRESYNLLFVGRICENKKQLELIDLIYHLKHKSPMPVRLILVGAVTSGHYKALIDQKIIALDLQNQVLFTGKVSDEKLIGLYRSADVFVCLSAHEGFGMPLIEAMRYKLPVVARASSNIADTLGEGGFLLPAHSTAQDCANAIWTLSREPGLRRQMIERQLMNLQRFSLSTVKAQLINYLCSIQINLPLPVTPTVHPNENEDWQIEGPFDSSYSLAIVNRELAKALDQQHVAVRLRSHEGYGDFVPNPEFMQEDPVCQRLHQAALDRQLPPYAALRFCYPPFLDDMPATARVVHSYGWEETGFPSAYVEEFNRRLDLITVLSSVVEKTLRDSGVRVPIVVTGAGVDHLLRIQPQALPATMIATCKGFRFLHISSCFPRKGIDVLLRAYGAAFRAADDVSLIIKTFPNAHNTVLEQLQTFQQEDAEFPHVLIINEDWDDQRIVALYQFAGAFVAPSRGEGFGLPMAEAMLFNLPVITTAWGGQADFCDELTAWCCDYTFQKAQTHMQLTHSLWAEPDMHDLAQLLRQVRGLDDAQRLKKTAVARRRILENFTWRNTAERIRAAVSVLAQQPLLRKQPKIAWISTWNARCGIANYSNYLTQSFPVDRLTILANHIVERMDLDQQNVIRCWTASETAQLDYAIEIIDEQNLEVIVIQYNFSFFSLATLAAAIERLKATGKMVYVFFHSTADVILPEQTKTLASIQTQLAMLDRIFVHGIDDMNRLKSWNLIDNVTYFPHGIALSPSPVNIPRALSAGADKVIIASYGFLLPHKGIPELIAAFSLLDHSQKNYHLLLLNALYPVSVSSDLQHRCIKLITDLGLRDKVTLITDFLSDTDTLTALALANLIVFPYQQTQESSSAAVRVGLASGRPVAVTPLTIFEDVEDAVTTLPGTSPGDLARGIEQFLDAPLVFQEKMTQVESWLQERRWPELSRRLLNLIDGIANPLVRSD
ncbi:glycosyltransferase [Undibacterium amnicola]|uniref:Glycosyltransferase n=1 Tax=Undibacterium amnicola TaxID=1834038 RepID=A0ABR6XS09_9BURK|nr:glycosyltransferase [Undibacterium amnicola]MBC3832232.1 glycosyltransferase [Undibacterium amnicola]